MGIAYMLHSIPDYQKIYKLFSSMHLRYATEASSWALTFKWHITAYADDKNSVSTLLMKIECIETFFKTHSFVHGEGHSMVLFDPSGHPITNLKECLMKTWARAETDTYSHSFSIRGKLSLRINEPALRDLYFELRKKRFEEERLRNEERKLKLALDEHKEEAKNDVPF